MPQHDIMVTQVLRVVRRIKVPVEAPTAEEAEELQSESDAPANDAGWEIVDSSVENEICKAIPMTTFQGMRGRYVTATSPDPEILTRQGWVISENPPKILSAGEVIPTEDSCVLVSNPPERPAGLCFCIDCGGDQPGHEPGCSYTQKLHGDG